jgi:thiol:disulfide interchange protein DsbD
MNAHRASILRLFGFCLAWLTLPAACLSAASIPHGTVDFVAEDQWIVPGHESYFGLHFQLEDGWHIYWVNPGDSGEPPRLEWRLPKGLTAGKIEWPAPQRLATPTITDFGYEIPVTLLVPVRAAAFLRPNQSAELNAELAVLVCREVCIPGKAHLALSIPVRPNAPAPDARTREIFSAARKSLPRVPPANLTVRAIDAGDTFVLTASIGRKISRAIFFPVSESQIDNSAPQNFQPLAHGFHLTLRKSDQLLKPITRLKGVLTISANESYEVDIPVRSSSAVEKVE